jgi:hypothetical protein
VLPAIARESMTDTLAAAMRRKELLWVEPAGSVTWGLARL